MIRKKKNKTFGNFFPVPKHLMMDPFAVDISPKSVKIMKMKNGKHGYVPVVYDEIRLKEVCSLLEHEDDLSECEELRSALVKLRDKHKISFVNVSLPELKTYIFKTKLPKEASSNIRQALKFKLEENVPLAPEDIIFNYSVTNDDKGNEDDYFDVTVAALPKGVIEIYTDLFHSIDLFPITFESESHALARAVVSEDDNNSYLLIHLGSTKINLSIIEKNVVQYASSVPVGAEQVIGDLNGTEAQILKEQINKLLVYWFTNEHDPDKHEKIEIAILSGRFVNTEDLVNFLERHLKLSVQVADVWKNCFSLDEYIPKISKADSLNYGISVGLALINKNP